MTIGNRIKQTWLATLLLLPASAISAVQQPDQFSSPVGVPSVLEFGARLLLVIAAIFIVGWFYARMQGMRGAKSDVINILASQSLGAKEKIILIEVGGKQIVVGTTSANLQTLHVFDEPILATDARTSNSTFADRLLTMIKGTAK